MSTATKSSSSFFARFSAHRGSRREGPKVGRGDKLRDVAYLPQLIPTLLIVIIGVITIWSAAKVLRDVNFITHLAGIVAGSVCAFIVWRRDTRFLSSLTLVLGIITCALILLPLVPGLGVEAKGMVGWVKIGPIRFQPSEFSKIVAIMFMAGVAAQYNGRISAVKDYIKLCVTVGVPTLLLMASDLGSGLVFFTVAGTIVACSGAPMRWVVATAIGICVLVGLVVFTSTVDGLPHILKPYQLKRLTVFIDPSVDPVGDGYQLTQAKIAVGSGGFFGKGLGNATQVRAGFLPEAHTDFVFALFAEEWGFVGSAVLLGLFAWMLLATVVLALKTEAPFARLVLVGCIAMWTFQVLENVGMCLGVMPITGIPLPFVSFGSSSMLVQLVSVGVVQSIWRHRQRAA